MKSSFFSKFKLLSDEDIVFQMTQKSLFKLYSSVSKINILILNIRFGALNSMLDI